MISEAVLNFEHGFSLMDLAQFTDKCAILHAFKTIVKTGISNLCVCSIVCDVINKQIAHDSTSLRQMAHTLLAHHVQKGRDAEPDFGG